MSRVKISAAVAKTDQIMHEVEHATALLAGPFLANGYGVFAEPQDTRRAIRAAIERLTAAERAFEGASWPTKAEYDAAES